MQRNVRWETLVHSTHGVSFFLASGTLMVKSMILLLTLNKSSLLTAPFLRSAVPSWTWLRCTFQVNLRFLFKPTSDDRPPHPVGGIVEHFWLCILLNVCSSAQGNPDVHISLGCVQWSGPPGSGAAVFGLPWLLRLCTVSSSTLTVRMCESTSLPCAHSLVFLFPGTRRFGTRPVQECGEEIALKRSPSSPGGTCFYDGPVFVLTVIGYFNIKRTCEDGQNFHVDCLWILKFFWFQASTSARRRISVRERALWMVSTGLGITLSTTGGCFPLVCISLKLSSHRWLCDHRYLRFFPDGQVVMLTTTEDPQAVVPRLHTKNTR